MAVATDASSLSPGLGLPLVFNGSARLEQQQGLPPDLLDVPGFALLSGQRPWSTPPWSLSWERWLLAYCRAVQKAQV